MNMKNKKNIIIVLAVISIIIILAVFFIGINKYNLIKTKEQVVNSNLESNEYGEKIEENTIDDSEENHEIIKQAMFEEDFYDIENIYEDKYVVYDQMSDEVKKENVLSEKEFDLDNDGTPESIVFTETKDKLVLKINNEIIDRYKKSELLVYIVDFDKDDDYTELLVRPNGWYDSKVDNAKIYDISIVNKKAKVLKNEIVNREYYYTNQNGRIIPYINSSSSNGSTIFDHINPIITQDYYELSDGKIKKLEIDIKNLVIDEFTASNFWYSNDYKKVEKLSRGIKAPGADVEDLCNKNQINFLDSDYKFTIKSIKKLDNNVVLETISGDDGTTQYIFDFGF